MKSSKNLLTSISVVFLIFFVLFSPALPKDPVFHASAQNMPPFIFLRDLREGDTGADVLELQRFLNTDAATKITGPTALAGSETGYFGQATKNAVIRFQNKYADEVLRPAGLIQGTGFVGLWSRLKLNQMILKSSVAVMPPPHAAETPAQDAGIRPTSSVATLPFPATASSSMNFSLPASFDAKAFGGFSQMFSQQNSTELALFYSSKYSGPAGSSLSLVGSGFMLMGNIVNFGDYKISNLASKNQNDLSFDIPADAPAGLHSISVVAQGKTSNAIAFMVTIPGRQVPVVEKVEPTQAKLGETVTITGRNFSPHGNMIISALTRIEHVPSTDGKTLTFTIPVPEYLKANTVFSKQIKAGKKESPLWPLRVYVINEYGISTVPNEPNVTITL